MDFSVEEGSIRYGLLAIKNVGKAALDLLIADRKEKGAYKNFTNFTYRSGSGKINRKVVEHLIKSGAFDELNEDRSELLKKLDGAETQSFSLFDAIDPVSQIENEDHHKKEMDPELLMNFEKEAMGFYFTYHPFSPYKNAFSDLDALDIAEIADITEEETRCTVFARIDSVRVPKKKNAKPQVETSNRSQSVIVTASDLTGTVEFIAYGKAMDILLENHNQPGAFVVELRIRNEEDRMRISLQEVKRFITREQMQRESMTPVQFSLYIDLDKTSKQVITDLIDLLRKYPGSNPVKLNLMKGTLEIRSEAGFKYRVSRSQELIQKLTFLLGKDNIGWRRC
jgi:DNA polymerase-3 subunit alpha